MTGLEPFMEGFRSGVKAPDRLPLSELATREVHLSGSQYGPKYDLSVVPAHEFVLNSFKDAQWKEIANVAPTGFGKTTIFEVCASYAVAQDPGDLLMLGQNDKLVKRWMESRLLKVLRQSPWTKPFKPQRRNQDLNHLPPHGTFYWRRERVEHAGGVHALLLRG